MNQADSIVEPNQNGQLKEVDEKHQMSEQVVKLSKYSYQNARDQKDQNTHASKVQQPAEQPADSVQKKSQSQKQQKIYAKFLAKLSQLNETVIYDISVKKGRQQKFKVHLNQISSIRDQFTELSKQNFREQVKISAYERMGIVYYNLARLGQNQEPLQTAITLLQTSPSNIYLVVRWKMQLAAMRSSSDHNGSFKLAVQVMKTITQILDYQRDGLKKTDPSLVYFIDFVLKVIRSDKRNDIIWVHNFQNNMKCFTDHIRQLAISFQPDEDQIGTKNAQNESAFPVSNSKINPFYPGYDFQIADYMSLQKLPIDYIQKFNQTSQIKQKIKQLAIYASICLFTQSTESYYMRDYSLKYLHFKAIQVALLTVDRECTFIGFLLKILNDYYGSKMSQIRQENSEIMEGNQLKRRIPRDKRQVKMNTLCFAE